jgi:flagellar protein FliT
MESNCTDPADAQLMYRLLGSVRTGNTMDTTLIDYYEAIERASDEMLRAARVGDWNEVVRIEGACALLISRLRSVSENTTLNVDQMKRKSRIMQRILINDAEIRHLVEPWLEEVDSMLCSTSRTLH